MRPHKTSFQKQIVRTFFQDSFNRDVIILLIISIVIGAGLAAALALSANTYFSQTISSLVGEYGEFDFLVNVREEKKEDGRAQIEQVMSQVFPGGKLKEGPTLTGVTSFLIGIPKEFKAKETYENIDSIFGSVPGRTGVSIMTEPRITIRAVPEGARDRVINEVMQIEGVLFAFRDGSAVTVLVNSLDQSGAVNDDIERVLANYQLIDIAFPVGNEPDNPVRLGEQLAEALRADKAIGFAESVSVDTRTNDMAYLVSTMIELKKFLTSYSTKVSIKSEAGVALKGGDVLAFQGAAPNSPLPGAAIDPANVLVQVTIMQGGTAEGMVIQGNAAQLPESQGYLAANSVIDKLACTATFRNPRSDLGNALGETSKLVGQIPGFAQDAQSMIGIANISLDNYTTSLRAVEQTLASLSTAGSTLEAATSGLAGLDTSAIRLQIGNSSQALGGLVNTLEIIRLVNPDVAASIAKMSAVQQNLTTLQSRLGTLDNVAADARRARSALDSIVANGTNTVSSLRSFDTQGARQSLSSTGSRLDQLQQFNTPLVAAQLEYLGAAVPNISDEEISRSVKLMDRYIAGQVIPSQRLQLLTNKSTTTELAAPTIYNVIGHSNVTLYTSAVGTVEPDPRAEVMVILSQVKALLAGMVSLISIIAFLTLDHTAIMTVIRRQRTMARKPSIKGFNRLASSVKDTFTAQECLYGMAIGALLLTVMFALSGGGIPYVPWIAVPLLGAVIGLIIANNAEKINPISSDEVSAGEALGLSFDEIMREIVIPNGRPGLMQMINRRKMKFK